MNFSQNLQLHAINNMSAEDKYYQVTFLKRIRIPQFIGTANMSEEYTLRLVDSKRMSVSKTADNDS